MDDPIKKNSIEVEKHIEDLKEAYTKGTEAGTFMRGVVEALNVSNTVDPAVSIQIAYSLWQLHKSLEFQGSMQILKFEYKYLKKDRVLN